MIPVLYGKSESEYQTNGIGSLSGAVSCLVTEERNGAFTLEMGYLSTGPHYAEITPGMQIMASVGHGRQTQPFEITKVTRPIGGRITILGEHKSYQMALIPVAPCEAQSVSGALETIKAHAACDCPFTFWTDKQTVAGYHQTVPASMRSRLGGEQGSILDVYGGEWEFDRFSCKLWSARGTDRGVSLRYGKNITDLSQEESIENTITGVYPFYQNESAYVELPEKVLQSEQADRFPYPRTITLDLTSEFEEVPDEEQLRTAAQSYMSRHDIGVPKVNLKVSFITLSDTEEYKDIAPLEEVRLCDIVSVYFEPLGIEAKAKVCKTVWNVLEDRYDSVEIGEARQTMAKTMAVMEKQAEETEEVVRSTLSAAIKAATDSITGVSGGVVRLNRNANGEPYELLVMDTDDPATAVNVWRWNVNGLGHSHSGYNGPFDDVAITVDGKLNASMITTGLLNANLLRTGRIASQVNPEDNYWDLDTGQFRVSLASVQNDEGEGLGSIIEGSVTSSKEYTDSRLAETEETIDERIGALGDSVSRDINSVTQALANSSELIDALNDDVVALGQRIWSDNSGRVHLSAADSDIQMVLQNNQIAFQYNGTTVGFINENGFNLPDGVLTNTLTLGQHWVWFEDASSGHLRLLWNP